VRWPPPAPSLNGKPKSASKPIVRIFHLATGDPKSIWVKSQPTAGKIGKRPNRKQGRRDFNGPASTIQSRSPMASRSSREWAAFSFGFSSYPNQAAG
ncbi:hypothetical protein ACLOJK_028246, partial [Asimina triloba]